MKIPKSELRYNPTISIRVTNDYRLAGYTRKGFVAFYMIRVDLDADEGKRNRLLNLLTHVILESK